MCRTHLPSGIDATVKYGEVPYPLEDGADLPAHGLRIGDSSPRGASLAGEITLDIHA